jgi:hypothetical protein
MLPHPADRVSGFISDAEHAKSVCRLVARRPGRQQASAEPTTVVEPADVGKARLAWDARRRHLGKMMPKKHGDKVEAKPEISANGGPVTFAVLFSQAAARGYGTVRRSEALRADLRGAALAGISLMEWPVARTSSEFSQVDALA